MWLLWFDLGWSSLVRSFFCLFVLFGLARGSFARDCLVSVWSSGSFVVWKIVRSVVRLCVCVFDLVFALCLGASLI